MKSSLDRQVGGEHYKTNRIQPVVFIERNLLSFCEGNVVKYIARSRKKNGLEDLNKAQHYLQILIEEHIKKPLPTLRTPLVIPVELFCAGIPEITRAETLAIIDICRWRRVYGLTGTRKISILQELNKNWHQVVNAWADSCHAAEVL